MMVTTTRGDQDEADLLKTTHQAADTDDYTVTWTEYCPRGCDGAAHRTNRPDTATVFCTQHVHHSVDVTYKRWPCGMDALQGSFG